MAHRHRFLALSTLALVVVAARWARRGIRLTEVAGHSMEPALAPGDYLVTIARTGRPARGDVVIVEHPSRSGLDLVKRVVGLPGETIEVAAGSVSVDGRRLAEPWADGSTVPDGTWHNGAHEIFLLGDHRAHASSDSRTLGPVRLPAQWWLARWRYWPPRRFGPI